MINPHELFASVRSKHDKLMTRLFWRDVLEIGAALGLIAGFVFVAIVVPVLPVQIASGFVILAATGLGATFFRERMRALRMLRSNDGTLRAQVGVMRDEVARQARLLRNIVWWYLLPLGVPGVVFCLVTFLNSPMSTAEALLMMVPVMGILIPVFGAVYWLNQRVVARELLPRQRELEQVIAQLESNPHA